jgi:predicted dehydrogenase
LATNDPASHLYVARVAFAGGASASMLFASAVGRLEETYDLFGEDWHVRVEWLSGAVEAFEAGRPVLQWRPAPADSPVYLNGTLEETREFLACVADGRPMKPDLEEALESFQLAETIQAAT